MEGDDRAPSRTPSDGRLLLRFAIGALYLGYARLLAELRASQEVPEEPTEPVRPRHPLLGALVLAPAALGSAVDTTRQLYRRSAGRLVAPGARWLRASGPGQRIVRRRRRLQLRIEGELARWGAIGQAEEVAGRALARATLRRLYVGVFDRMAESHKLQQLIHEQSAGLTRGVVGELRDLSAEADTRAETFVRRLWRRH